MSHFFYFWRFPGRTHISGLLACALTVLLAVPALAQFSNVTANANTNASVVQTDQVRAELIAFAPQGIQTGAPVMLGLQLQHQPHWHTYWKNPGDSGLPTQLRWDLPTGLQAGDIAWPTPQKIRIGSLANFGYEGTVVLPVPVTVTSTFKPAPAGMQVNVSLNATWLVCKEECVPQEGHFELHLPVQGSTALHARDFEQAQKAQAIDLPADRGTARVSLSPAGAVLRVTGLPADWQGKALNAFVENPEIIDTPHTPDSQDAVTASAAPSAATPLVPGTQSWDHRGAWQSLIPLSPLRTETPTALTWVLESGGHSLRIHAAVDGTWPMAGNAVRAPVAPAMPAAPLSAGFWLILLGALVGGMVLNLMPCVFPVLAIKVLAFSGTRAAPGHSHRAEGLAYSAGVILSFLGLGGLLLALRAGGAQLGWGFQLQSPGFVSALALLFTLIGMNLMGWLETGTLLPSTWGSIRLRHPLADAFLSGVLAVAIASPCTAPFMGASLGYAVALPAAQALLIFGTLGLGLALPYAVASAFPAVGRWMPRPGAWMDTIRRFLAFPMWATVVWLLWVLAHITGIDGAFSLLACLLGLALLLWSLQLDGRSKTILVSLSSGVLLALVLTLGRTIVQQDSAGNANETTQENNWAPWSPARVTAELAAGHPVFVNFTAAWCITCQYNKRNALANADVQADFKAHNVRLLEADWTRQDPAISQALNALGRSGVPVYVLYQAGQAPRVLSEILTVDALRSLIRVN